MLTVRLAIPFLVIIALTAIFVENETIKAIVIGVCVVPIGLVYMFKPQLDWWYYQRNPQMLHPKMRNVLLRFSSYFEKLQGDVRIRFEQRMFMIMQSRAYEKKNLETIPEDLKGLIAGVYTQLTLGLEEYFTPKYEMIVLYPQKFPSPKIPVFHTSEVFEDGHYGGVVFAVNHAVNALQDPNHYNIVMHEFSNLLWTIKGWDEKAFLEFATKENLTAMAKIRGFSFPQIQKFIGKPQINFYAVAIEHFFAVPDSFKQFLPEFYQAIANQLNQDPTNKSNPIKNAVLIEEK